MRKCNLDARLTGNSAETSGTHTGVSTVPATIYSAIGSLKRQYVHGHDYNAYSSTSTNRLSCSGNGSSRPVA
ncbi:hypothetical protein Tco_0636508, partial [Tanacetum coccineum]